MKTNKKYFVPFVITQNKTSHSKDLFYDRSIERYCSLMMHSN